jgi:hypothetical protein
MCRDNALKKMVAKGGAIGNANHAAAQLIHANLTIVNRCYLHLLQTAYC